MGIADLHIHMGYADHLKYISVEEVVKAAIRHDVNLIGIVDHYEGHEHDVIVNKIKEQVEQVRRKFPEVEILFGMETSVLTVDGEINIKPEIARKLDFLIVGMHHIPAGGKCLPYEMKGKISVGEVKNNPEFQSFLQKFNFGDLIDDWQKTTLSLMHNPLISIYAHPVQWPFVVMRKFLPRGKWLISRIEDIIPPQVAQDIFSAAKEAGIAWEVNNEYLPPKYRVDNKYVCCADGRNSWSGMINLFRIIGKFGVKVSLGSDAHCPDELERVGRLENAMELLRLAKVNKENIILRREQIRYYGTST